MKIGKFRRRKKGDLLGDGDGKWRWEGDWRIKDLEEKGMERLIRVFWLAQEIG